MCGKNVVEIDDDDDVPVLGVLINKHMNWKAHVNRVPNKVAKFLILPLKLKKFIYTRVLTLCTVSWIIWLCVTNSAGMIIDTLALSVPFVRWTQARIVI